MTRTAHPNNAWRRLGAAVLLSCALIASTAEAKETTAPSSAPVVLTLEEAAQLLRIRSDELERLALRNKVPARRMDRVGASTKRPCWHGSTEIGSSSRPPSRRMPLPSLRWTWGGSPERAPVSPKANPEPAGEDSASGGKSQDPIGEAPEERTAEEVFLRAQKVLLAPGRGDSRFRPVLFPERQPVTGPSWWRRRARDGGATDLHHPGAGPDRRPGRDLAVCQHDVQRPEQ